MERFKIFKNDKTKKWDVYSVYGEYILSFDTEYEAVAYIEKRKRNYRIMQAKLGRHIDD